MKFGCCADIDKAEIVDKAGYDFLECSVLSLKPEEDESIFDNLLTDYRESPIPIEVFNKLLPADLKIVGNSVDQSRIQRYLETAIQRMTLIGAKMVVFGSGGARSVPEGFSRERAEEQILQFLDMAAEIADPLNFTIVIEPLNLKEANNINSVQEGVEYAKKINRRSIQVLADFYHMDEEKEPLTNIISCKSYLKHIHVADTGRFSPGTGEYPYEAFVDCVKAAGYNSCLSVECRWNHFEKEVVEAKQFLDRIFI